MTKKELLDKLTHFTDKCPIIVYLLDPITGKEIMCTIEEVSVDLSGACLHLKRD